MNRRIETELHDWAQHPRRKPLILRGARQVGKTWSVVQLGKTYFNNRIHKIDLEKKTEWHSIFDGNLDVSRILAELEIVLNVRIVPGEDLLFLDEIQSCPRALMALRYFYEDLPELHVIAAGSLLEFALQDISFPVGRVQFMEMYPLTFEEYLVAVNKQKLSETLRLSPESLTELSFNLLRKELRSYFFVGGMPEVVDVFATTESYEEAFERQDSLIEAFQQDFSKYAARADKTCLQSVFKNAAKNVGKITKYANLANNFSTPTIHKAYDLLCTAKILNKIRSTSPSGTPLSVQSNEKRFKTTLLDLGLMRSLAEISPREIIEPSTNLLGIYEGALAEQFVGQELLASGAAPYFWTRDAKSSQAEVDYLVSVDGEILPIEVKSASSGRLKSLHLLLKEFLNCKTGCVLSDRPFSILPSQNLIFLPLFYAGHLHPRVFSTE